MKEINNFAEYQQIVDRYGQRGCASNDYIQNEAADLIIHNLLFAACSEKNAFLFVKKGGFYRVYYYINDFDDVMDFGSEEVVTEILFRGSIGEPAHQVAYLEKCGFKRNLVRDQYIAKYSSFTAPVLIGGIKIGFAETIEQVEWAIKLFNASFDKWSGDYIPLEKSGLLLQEQDILLATDVNGSPLGALEIEKRQGCTWLNHVVVVPEARGQKVGRGLVEAYIEQGHVDDNSRYAVWVQRQNTPAVKMYQNKGFTYSNKSTLSMIKK